jgi:para-aminobenzoate synthetase/4-amino-4-deoxychorismate lyase
MLLRFDFVNRSGVVEPIRFAAPRRVIVARTIAEVAPAMAAVDASLRMGQCVAGFVAYEAASGFDDALLTQPPTDVPLVWFGVFDAPEPAPPLTDLAPAPTLTWTSAIGREDYRRGIDAIRAAIADGDTYQINYTFRQRTRLDPETLPALYASLARAAQVPYGALLDTGDWHLLSLSPELFFRIDRGRLITQPMKGTAARGRWREDDDTKAEALARSEKNRAENVMIVDLARNDVTRVAEPGTVQATSLFHVDRYPSVLQMVSTVEADLRPGTTLSEIFRALFPAGSITGAPKSSSMRLIASLEHAPRGAYCGAIGFASPDGHAVFNVGIRTITASADGHAVYGVGGGITWDSEAGDEYAEAISKAACLVVRPDFDLLETLRIDDGEPIRLDGHLARMIDSAAFFGFIIDLDCIRAAIAAEIRRHAIGRRRLRVRVSRTGAVSVESVKLAEPPAGRPVVELATSPVDRDDRFLFHKTSLREVYAEHAAQHPEAFDVLLWNEAGELTEFTRGNLVVELDGARVTPPRECGLLAGVLRNQLLQAGTIRERVLTKSDLGRATRVWFVNSLREWIPVEIAGDTLTA